MRFRNAILGGCLSLPLAGFAGAAFAHSPSVQTIQVPPGAFVLVLPAPVPVAEVPPVRVVQVPLDVPTIPMFAQQDAIMHRMVREMQVLDRLAMRMPDPSQVLHSVLDGGAWTAPGSGVVTTIVSNGHGTCRQTITYSGTPGGAAPIVHVAQSGNACGIASSPPSPPMKVRQAPPVMPQAVPPTPHQPRLWTVGDPPHPITAGVPRT